MKYYEINIKTKSSAVDLIGEVLSEMGIESFSIVDPQDQDFHNKEVGKWDYMDPDEIFDLDFEGVLITLYIDPEDIDEISNFCEELKRKIKNLENFNIDVGLNEIDYKLVESDDWMNAWKEFYKPFEIGENIIVKPSWESIEDEVSKNKIIIEIEPGNAFGSGTHETTFLCMEQIERILTHQTEFGHISNALDIGCGSGILGITAAKFGIDKVLGVDIDVDSVVTAKENIEKNHVMENMDAVAGDLIDVVHDKYDLVIANILADIIIGLSDDVSTVISDNGYFLCSGIIEGKKDEVVEALKRNQLHILDVVQSGEWVAILAKKGMEV